MRNAIRMLPSVGVGWVVPGGMWGRLQQADDLQSGRSDRPGFDALGYQRRLDLRAGDERRRHVRAGRGRSRGTGHQARGRQERGGRV